MNLEKFTERSRGFLQAAQTIAMRESHQRVLPDHLLKALMDDDQGLAANLIRKAGGSPEQVNAAINASIAKLPKVTYFTMGLNKWQTSDTWPPAGATPMTFFLSSGGNLRMRGFETCIWRGVWLEEGVRAAGVVAPEIGRAHV